MLTMLVLAILSIAFGIISTRIIGLPMSPKDPRKARARGPKAASSRLLMGLLLFGSGLAIAVILALRWLARFIERALS